MKPNWDSGRVSGEMIVGRSDDDKTIRLDEDLTVREQDSTIRQDISNNNQKSDFGRVGLFDSYKVIQEFDATGGEADTFLVEKSGVRYFLKLYRKGIKPKESVLRKLSSLSKKLSDHVVVIHEFGVDDVSGRCYELMEYIEYGDLKRYFDNFKNQDAKSKEQFLKAVVKELAEALNALHNEGIVHRDLKPTNVLVRSLKPLDLVIADFGISVALFDDVTKVYTETQKGSFAYMAPEELSNYFGKEIDWWHLGIILYELLVGKNPFSGLSEAVVKHYLTSENISIPEDIEHRNAQLLKGLLTRNPRKRWQYEQVRAWLNGEDDIPVYFEDSEGKSGENLGVKQKWFNEGFSEDEYSLFMENGFTLEKAIEFRNVLRMEGKLSREQIREWVQAGFKDPRKVIRWSKENFEAFAAKVFDDYGVTPSLARELLQYGLTAYEFKVACERKKKTPKDISIKDLIDELASGFKPFEREEWRAHGFRLEEANRLKKVVYDVDEALEWRENGFNISNISKIEMWRSCGFSPRIAKMWEEKGYSPQEATMWRNNGFSPSNVLEWKRAGFTPVEAGRWFRAGFTVNTANSWKLVGINDPEVAASWKANNFLPQQASQWAIAGFSPHEARLWYENDFYEPDKAALWKSSGFKPDVAIKWFRSQFEPEEAKEWEQNGFEPEDAKQWRRYFSPQEARNWKGNNFVPLVAKEWKDAGFNPQEAREWLNRGFRASQASEWKSAGFDVQGALIWRSICPMKMSIEDAAKWHINRFSPEEALSWKNERFSPQEAREWVDEGFSLNDVSVIRPWKENGFSAKRAKAWMQVDFDVLEAKKWEQEGFEPVEAKEWKEFGYGFEKAKVLKKYDFIPQEAKRWENIGFDIVSEMKKQDPELLKLSKNELKDKAKIYNDKSLGKIREEVQRKIEEINLSDEAKQFLVTIDDYEKLNALLSNARKSLVIAGPGSGKTDLIARKIAFLLLTGVKPSEILLVTFTRQAADEMIERVRKYANRPIEGITYGTFHHVFNVISNWFKEQIFQGYDWKILEEENAKILMEHAKSKLYDGEKSDLQLDLERVSKYNTQTEILYKIYSYARNTINSIANAARIAKREFRTRSEILEANSIIEKYEELKKEEFVKDFDDILLEMIKLLSNNASLRKVIADKFKWIIIDEFQDTNIIQLRFAELISTEKNHLFVIADDAQSIYSFRGGNFDAGVHFLKDAEIYMIRTNYRSRESIVKVINSVLPSSAIPKTLRAASNKMGGDKPYIAAVRNEGVWQKFVDYFGLDNENIKDEEDRKDQVLRRLEAEFILRKIIEYTKVKGLKYEDIAVLYRSAYLSTDIELVLEKNNIPFEVHDSKKFSQEPPICHMVAFLNLFIEPTDIPSWYQIFSLIKPYGGSEKAGIIDSIRQSQRPIETFIKSNEILDSLGKSQDVLIRLRKLREAFKRAQGYVPPYKQLEIFFEVFYKEECKYVLSVTEQEINQIMITAMEFIEFAKNYKTIGELLKAVAKIDSAFVVEEKEPEKGRVVLSTIHQAKGLEWKVVFLIGAVPGHLPLSKGDPEEEERLFYVAVSRAKEWLYIMRSPGLGKSSSIEDLVEKIPDEFVSMIYIDDFLEKEIKKKQDCGKANQQSG